MATWFEPLVPLEVNRTAARVGCPNRFYQAWLEEHYQDPLKQALAAAGVAAAEVELEIMAAWPPRISAGANPILTLDPDLTFESFVVGSGNQLAYEAARAVADEPGVLYSPLVIAGDIGEGKTHLLHAIGHAVLRKHPELRLRQLSASRLFELLVDAVQRDETTGFRQELRSTDILLMDDLHTLVGREGTQEEFFHSFNALHTAGKQLVFASREPPSSLVGIPDRIRSRLSWGLVVRLEPGDKQFRFDLARQTAERLGWPVPSELLKSFVTSLEVNNRELVGLLHRAAGICKLTGDDPEPVLTSILKEREDRARRVGLDDILRATSERTGLRLQDLRGPRRSHPLTRARQLVSFLAHEYTKFSFPAIGRALGGRDHTTILYSVRKARERLSEEPDFAETMRILRRDLAL